MFDMSQAMRQRARCASNSTVIEATHSWGSKSIASRPRNGPGSLSCLPNPFRLFIEFDWPSSCSKPVRTAQALTEAQLVKPDPTIGGEDRYNIGCVFARSAASSPWRHASFARRTRGPREVTHQERPVVAEIGCRGRACSTTPRCATRPRKTPTWRSSLRSTNSGKLSTDRR